MLAMIEANLFPALVLLGAAASLGASGLQQPSARPVYHRQPAAGNNDTGQLTTTCQVSMVDLRYIEDRLSHVETKA